MLACTYVNLLLMDKASLKQEVLDHYLDDDLQVTIDRDPGHWSTQNGLMHTGVFYTILGINNLVEYADKDRFNRAVKACWANGIPGLLNRNPGRPDLEAHDDYIGVCAASYFLQSMVGTDILNYGENNLFCYNNVHPGTFTLQCWQGKFPGIVGFYRMAANRSPGNFQTLAILTNLHLGVKERADQNILMWLMVSVFRSQSSRFNDAIAWWDSELRLKYGTLGNMFKEYFGNSHPFAKINSMNGILP